MNRAARVDWKSFARRARAEWSELSGRHTRHFAELDGSRAAILAYHRVLPRRRAQAGFVEAGMFVTPDTFAAHLDALVEDFEVVTLESVIDAFSGESELPKRACVITFDDGWRDNFEFALPLLRERKLPATVFLVTDRIGSEGSFWPDEVCVRLGSLPISEGHQRVSELLDRAVSGDPSQVLLAAFKEMTPEAREERLARLRELTPKPETQRELLDWPEIDAMAEAGISFESHSKSHAILTLLRPGEIEGELRESRAALESRGHGRSRVIAYPSGAFDPSICDATAAAGYRAGVTMHKGHAERDADPYQVARIPMHDDISRSRSQFRRRLTGRL